MEAFEAIKKRRSVRKFTGASIPRADLEKIVDAGRLAATGSNRQPWDFIVVTDPAMIDKLIVVGKWMKSAAAIIAVVLDPYSHWWLEDGSAAIENMLIAATALGYGSCWVEGDSIPYEDLVKTLLEIPQGKHMLALIPVGVPESWPTVDKRSLSEVLHWEKY